MSNHSIDLKSLIQSKSNITLIGMPGAGKSTLGIILAKEMVKGFLDADVLIQINQQSTLQSIMDTQGYLKLREIEAQEVQKINIDHHVISTGGSVIYYEETMRHLEKNSIIVYLNVDIDTIKQRVHNFGERGIAKAKDQSLESLFAERHALYSKYAHVTIDNRNKTIEESVQEIQALLSV